MQQGNQTTPVKLTCEQCFTKFLTSTQISALLRELAVTSFTDLCPRLSEISISILQSVLRDIEGVSESTIAQLIQCLLDAGVQFGTGTG